MSAEAPLTTASHPDPRHRTRLILAFAAVYIAWGSSYLATRVGVKQLPPFLFGAARFITSGLIMLGVARLSGERVRPLANEWRHLAVLALFGFLIANGAGVWGMQFVPSNQSALLNTTVPCWITLLGAFGLRAHRPRPLALLGLALGFAGTALLMKPASGAAQVALWPQVVIVLGCLGWAISSLYQRTMDNRLAVSALIGWQMLLGGLALAVTGLLAGEAARWHWSWRSVLPLAYLIVFASCLAHTAYAWLAPRATPTSLGTYAYVNPVIATVLGWLLLNEHLSAVQLCGMAATLAGVVLIGWPKRPATGDM